MYDDDVWDEDDFLVDEEDQAWLDAPLTAEEAERCEKARLGPMYDMNTLEKIDDGKDEYRPFPFELSPISKNEIFSLDHTVAIFILPRLKMYRECVLPGITWGCFSGLPDGRGAKLTVMRVDEMIAAFELLASDGCWSHDSEQGKIVKKGLNSFRKYFNALWY